MTRREVWSLVWVAFSIPALAQPSGPRLHREIPGDLGLSGVGPAALSNPDSAEALQQAAGGQRRWDENQRPGEDVLRPRQAWSSPVREIDTETRSPAGMRLQYQEVFNPSVSPFKRTQAYDAVDEMGRLVVRDPSLRPLLVGQRPRWSSQEGARFTGDVFVELAPGVPTPVPSVAAEQVVVSYRTVPEIALVFAQDSAGNLMVQSALERPQRLRLTYVLEAPESAFAAPFVPATPLSEVASRAGLAAPPVPAFLRDSLDTVLRAVALRRSDSLQAVVARLTEYFRRFRDDVLTEPVADNRYRALSLGRVGACRHRAYAFVLTLHGLGVPARYVGNEAHAWAEVALPGLGWTRIDLGGWDVGLDTHTAGERESFVPLNPDPLPRPREYTNGYSTRGGTGRRDPRHRPDEPATAPATGPTPDSAAQASGASPGDGAAASASGATGATGAMGVGGATGAGGATGVGGATGAGGATAGARAEARGDTAATGETQRERDDDAPPPMRTTLRITNLQVGDEPVGEGIVRGRAIRCQGETRDETGAPVVNLPVEIALYRNGRPFSVGRGGRSSHVLGTTVSRDDGRFEAEVLVPFELEAGEYDLRAHTPGDLRHRAALSD